MAPGQGVPRGAEAHNSSTFFHGTIGGGIGCSGIQLACFTDALPVVDTDGFEMTSVGVPHEASVPVQANSGPRFNKRRDIRSIDEEDRHLSCMSIKREGTLWLTSIVGGGLSSQPDYRSHR